VNEVDLLQMLIQYGLAGVALWMLYTLTYHKISKLEEKMERLTEKMEELINEVRELKEAIKRGGG